MPPTQEEEKLVETVPRTLDTRLSRKGCKSTILNMLNELKETMSHSSSSLERMKYLTKLRISRERQKI